MANKIEIMKLNDTNTPTKIIAKSAGVNKIPAGNPYNAPAKPEQSIKINAYLNAFFNFFISFL